MNKVFLAVALVAIILSLQANSAFASFQYNPIPPPAPINHDKILIIVSNWPFVIQNNVYAFQLRSFDAGLVANAPPLEQFRSDQGDLAGVSINATLYNYDNVTVLHKFSGVTNQFGWFDGSVLMQNETPDKTYTVVFTANYPHMVNTTKTFSFELIDHRQVGSQN